MEKMFTAKTRGGQTAHFQRMDEVNFVKNGWGAKDFVLMGYINEGEPELWTTNGFWDEHSSRHEHDLIFK